MQSQMSWAALLRILLRSALASLAVAANGVDMVLRACVLACRVDLRRTTSWASAF